MKVKNTCHETPRRGAKLLIPILALMIISFGCGVGTDPQLAFIKVQKERFEIMIPAFGQLQAVKATSIIAPPQLQGNQTLVWIAPENTRVKKGEIVARLNANWYKEQIQEEEFQIAKLNLEIQKKQKELEKEKNNLLGQLKITALEKETADLYRALDESLYSRNQIIEDSIDLDYLTTKTRHYEQKKANLEKKSRAELQLLQLKRQTHQVKVDQYKSALNSLEIAAPHDGMFIYQRNWRGEAPHVGSQVWRGQKLGELPDLTDMEAKVNILESEAGGLKENLPVTLVLVSRPEIPITGKVTAVDKIAKALEEDSPLKYFEAKVAPDKTDPGIMKPGSQVKATIFVQKLENVIAVPHQALVFEQGKIYVHVKHSSALKKQEVETGPRSLTRTVITKGLAGGEKILLGKPREEGK